MAAQESTRGWWLAFVAALLTAGWAAGQSKQERDEAMSLWDKATALKKRGEPAEAEKAYRAALAKAERGYGKDHATTGVLLTHLAGLYLDMGQYAKAEPLLKRALDILEARLGRDHPDVAASLNNLAGLYSGMGQHAKAEPLYLRSLGICEARLGKDHPNVASALSNLAGLYSDTGQYAKAEPLYRRAVGIREAKLGRDHPHVASSLNGLAALYTKMGRYARAEPLFKRGLTIREAKLGKGHPDVATSLDYLALLYLEMGQYARAEPLFKRALDIREARLGRGHPDVADSLNSLAGLYLTTGQYARAEPLFKRALGIREAGLGEDHPQVATTLNNLAGLYLNMGQYARAEPLYRRSLRIWEARLGKDHPDVAASLNSLATLYKNMGQYARAEPLLKRGLGIQEAKLGKDHPDVAASLNGLAVLQAEQGRTKEAARLLERSRRASRRHVSRVLPALPPREQALFLAVSERERLALALSLALADPGDASLAARSAAWLLNGKAAAEEALAQSALLARDSADPALGKLAGRLREARAELARLTLSAAPPDQEKARHDRLEALAKQEQGLAERLAGEGGAAGAGAEWVEPGGLRKALPAGGALVDVARLTPYDFKAPAGKRWRPDRYVAWVTLAKGDAALVDLGPADAIDAAVKDIRQSLEKSAKLIREKGEPEAEKALRAPLEKLSALVLRPLLPHLSKAKRWYVSPDGNLWLVPWEALLLRDGKYAVEEHTVSYVSSGRDLVAAPRYKGKPGRPLVVADPDFDLDAKTARTETARMLAKRAPDEETRGLPGALRLGGIGRLPGTLAEAKAINAPLVAYTKQAPRELLGKYALEGLVKEAKGPRVLVLSTHGFFLPHQEVKPTEGRSGDDKGQLPPGWENPLVRCGLLLAGCNHAAKAAEGDDGILTGLEVVGMDLRGTEMLVLSACETGLGDVQNGEGVAGLRQAFRLAGAESVVSTLWKVPDKSSSRLMTLFFHGLAKGKGRAAALREAQRKLIEQRRDDAGAAHPLFWAAFTLTGRE
jgi:CHAT domain-containing protein/Tfp pilus assembly protein PilF